MTKINLLPPQTKESINYAKRNRSLISGFFIFLTVFGVLTFLLGLGLLLTYTNLTNVRKSVVAKHNQAETVSKVDLGERKNVDVQEESERLQRKITAIGTIEREQLFWSKAIDEVSVLTPDSVYLSSLPLKQGTPKDRLTFSGFAVDQLSVAVFRDALDSSSFFRHVDILSLTSAADSNLGRRGYNFSMSASITSYCLFSGAQSDDVSKKRCNTDVEKLQ